jgi:long-chain acyl-CoA synthetase
MPGDRTLRTIVRDMPALGDRPALIAFTPDGKDLWSFARLGHSVRRLAAGLAARGLAPGSFVGVIAPNSASLVIVRLALIEAGLVAAPVDDAASPGAAARALSRCDARALFTTTALAPALRAAAGSALEHVYLLDAPEGDPASWRHLPTDAEPPPRGARPEDKVALIFTSGTTGEAKGVPLTHANFLVDIDALANGGFIDASDRVLLPLPLHHAYPFMAGLMLPLACGATVVLPAGLAAPEIARALKEARATVMCGVPRLYHAMAQGILARIADAGAILGPLMKALFALSMSVRKRTGWRIGRILMRPVRARFAPDLKLLASGGAKLDEETAWTLEGLGFEVLSGYGLVETSSVSTYNRKGRGRIGTEGLPVPGTEIRIAEPDGDGIGEIQLRGPHVFEGYFCDPATTQAAFTPERWFKTGDLGRLEADGSVVVLGRSKEVIVLANGKNVGPEEVEDALAASPYIAEAAVLERRGDLVALVVPDMRALQESATSRVDELLRVEITRAGVDLEPYKRVTGYRVWREPLPRTRLGKIQRFRLAELYDRAERSAGTAVIELSAEDLAMLSEPLARTVYDLLKRRFPDASIGLETSLQLDLAVDSLGWIELTHEIEAATGRAIVEDAIARIVTVRDLLHVVAETAPSTTTAAPAVVPVALPPPRGPVLLPFAWCFYWFLRIVMRGLYRIEIRGAVPAGDRQTLVAVNHLSDLDPPVVAAALPWRFIRDVWWGADVNRVFDNGIKRVFTRLAQVFPVDDRRPGETLAYAKAALATGAHLIWFPESWRSPDGRLQQFSRGIGVIVQDSRPAVVVPAFIVGTFEAMPRHRTIPRITRVRIAFGPPIPGAEFDGCATSNDPAAAAAAVIRKHIAALDGYHAGS